MLQKIAEVQAVDAATVKAWLDAGEIVLVDVRETKEYEQEHIPGALLLPLSSFDPEMFPSIAGKKVVLHCAVGKRSEAAGKMLLKEGHAGVLHMEGGLNAWKAAGFPVEEEIPEPPESAPAEPVFLCPSPGEVLVQEYLTPLGITLGQLADRIGVAEERLERVIAGAEPVDVELSMRLGRFFSTAADFWVKLQVDHDLERKRHAIGETLRREIRPRATWGAVSGC